MEKSVTPKGAVFSPEFPNPKIIFLVGPPSSGKNSQAERLISELGSIHISLTGLMHAEIKRGTPDGQTIEKSLKSGQLPSKVLRVGLLSREIATNPNHSYVITGFLKSLDEALEFEKQVTDIKLIVEFKVNDHEGHARINEGKAKEIANLDHYYAKSRELIDFYAQFGAVRETDAVGTPELVFKRFKQAIRPEVFFIIGPPGSGKTTQARKMAEKYNLHLIDSESFSYDKDQAGKVFRINDDNELSRRLMHAMEKVSSMRFLVEGFPSSVYALKQFELAFAKPKKIFYIALYKEELMQRSSNPNINTEYLNYMKKMSPLIDALDKKLYFAKINANLSVENTFAQISKHIEPEVVMIRHDPEGSFSNYLHNQGFNDVNLHDSMSLSCKRQTQKGKMIMNYVETGKIVPTKTLISLVQDSLYNGSSFGKKFILKGKYPATVKELNFIEKHCAKITKIYHVTHNPNDPLYVELEKEEIDTHLVRENKLAKIIYDASLSEEDRFTFFSQDIQERLERKKGKYIVVLGQYLTGKTTVSKYIADSLKFKLINYEELPDQIKAKKSTEEEPYENVTWQDIIEELSSQTNNPNYTIILDGFPPETMVLSPDEDKKEEEEEVIEKDKNLEYYEKIRNELIQALGTPYVVLHTTAELQTLEKRLFESLQLGEEDELTEEHHEIFKESALKEKPFLDWFDSIKLNITDEMHPQNWKTKVYYQVDTSKSITRTKEFLDSIFSLKFILVEGERNKAYENHIDNLCINYDIFHVNMDLVIFEEINSVSEKGNLIQTMIHQQIQLPLSLKYSLIQDYLKKHLTYRSQLILLSHFSTSQNQFEYPRGMDTFLTLEETLGKIISVIRICNKKGAVKVDVDHVPVVHYPPPKTKEEQEQEEKKSEDENEELQDSQNQKNEPVELPPRSNPKDPIGLSKLFQLYKRNTPQFETLDEIYSLDVCFKRILSYMRLESYLSAQDSIRLRCTNLQVIV